MIFGKDAVKPGTVPEKTNARDKKAIARRATSNNGGVSRDNRSGTDDREVESGQVDRDAQEPHRETISDLQQVFSAIDLGTNNCRLLIAKPTRSGFRVIDAFSRIVRLGEGVSNDSVISNAAMERAVSALAVCAQKVERRGVTHMRHVATQACRVASNTEELLKRIKQETGLDIEVISAQEEARLAVMGCQNLVARSNKHALIFDIGGGSTELMWVKMTAARRSVILGWTSIPWGVVNLSERFDEAGDGNRVTTYEQMTAIVKEHLDRFERKHKIGKKLKRRGVQLLGTSGTVTTLASLHLNLPRYNREKVDGAWMKADDIEKLSLEVAMMSFEQRAAQPCIGEDRADLVVAGCAILSAILSTWAVQNLRVADRGIREGILRSLMQMDQSPIMASNFQRSKRRR